MCYIEIWMSLFSHMLYEEEKRKHHYCSSYSFYASLSDLSESFILNNLMGISQMPMDGRSCNATAFTHEMCIISLTNPPIWFLFVNLTGWKKKSVSTPEGNNYQQQAKWVPGQKAALVVGRGYTENAPRELSPSVNSWRAYLGNISKCEVFNIALFFLSN